MDSSLSTYSDILSTFALLTDSAGELVGSTQSLLPGIEGMIDNGQSTVNGMQGSVLSGAQTASTISSMVDISLGTVKDQLDMFGAGGLARAFRGQKRSARHPGHRRRLRTRDARYRRLR